QDGSEIVTVTLMANNPTEAVTLVQAVVKSYEEQVVNLERDRRQARVKELEGIYTKADKQLRQDKEDLRQRIDQFSTTDKELAAQQQMTLMADLSEAKRQQTQAHHDRNAAERRLEAAKTQEKTIKETPVNESEIAGLMDADPDAKNYKSRVE